MMRKITIGISLSAMATFGGSLDVRAYGARGDGVAKDTKAIQSAIDAAAHMGGGTVRIGSGTYLTGSLYLKSGVDLFLDDATLKGSPDKEDYNAVDVCPQNWSSRAESASGAHLLLCIEQTTPQGPHWWGREWWSGRDYAIICGMRQPRNFATDRCYHLVSRIANRAFYLSEEERTRFVERMWRVAYFSCVDVLAYCVMDNHFHILAYVPPQRELSEEEVLARVRTLYLGDRLVAFEKDWALQLAHDKSVGPSMYCVKGESEKTLHG